MIDVPHVHLEPLLPRQPVASAHLRQTPYYPSFYPQEIRVEFAEPSAALRLFEKNAIHAYVGPLAAPKAPAHLAWVESLRSFVVLTFNPARAPFTDPRERCAAAARLAPALATAKGAYVFHPYPVTPYHGDYLHHADLVIAAKARTALRRCKQRRGGEREYANQRNEPPSPDPGAASSARFSIVTRITMSSGACLAYSTCTSK